ncbi:MAG: helix-turn-helix domain-containing protein [Clostridia bacterium]|nr:helix-turn-helix domain-containing protein [Clostridia bacterium]
MKSTLFSDGFAFVDFNFGRYRYTDNRHGSPYHYLAVMKEGRCRIAAADYEITAQAGEAFYIPMGLPYQSYWHSDGSVRFLSYGFVYFPGNVDYRLQKLPEKAAELITSIPLGYAPDAAALGRLYTVLGELLPEMEQAEMSAADRLVRTAMEYMARDRGISVPELARLCCVSESTLYAAFRTAAGMTPNDMRQKLVAERAVKLLMTTAESVQQISDRLGFSSTDYFRRVLRKHTGMSPREIRSGARRV